MGERGIVHLHGFLENADVYEVTGLYNRTPGRAEAAAEDYKVADAAIFHDLDAALEKCRPDVAAICLPPSSIRYRSMLLPNEAISCISYL